MLPVFLCWHILRWFCSSHHSNCFIWNLTRSNSRIIWVKFLLHSVRFCLICNNIMHILPLPLCGLYSVREQNGRGPHHPCKIILLTLVTNQGSDRPISFMRNIYLWSIEHARTAYHKTCGTEYQQPYRRFKSQTPKDRTTNEIRHKRAQWACLTYHVACKVESQPPIDRAHNGRLSVKKTSDTFTWEYLFYIEKRQLWVRPMGGWNSTLQAAWYFRHAHWARLCHIPFVIWCLWIESSMWLLILSSTSFMVGRSRVFYSYSSWKI